MRSFCVIPTLKNVVDEIEDDEDGEPTYQGQKVKRYLQEKRFIKDHAVHIIERIISSIEERYGKVCSEGSVLPSKSKYEVSDEGDSVIFDVCCILNTNVLPNLEHAGDQDDDEDLLQVLRAGAAKKRKQFNMKEDISSSSSSSDVSEE